MESLNSRIEGEVVRLQFGTLVSSARSTWVHTGFCNTSSSGSEVTRAECLRPVARSVFRALAAIRCSNRVKSGPMTIDAASPRSVRPNDFLVLAHLSASSQSGPALSATPGSRSFGGIKVRQIPVDTSSASRPSGLHLCHLLESLDRE